MTTYPVRTHGGDGTGPHRLAARSGVLDGRIVDGVGDQWLRRDDGDHLHLLWPARFAASANPLALLDGEEIAAHAGQLMRVGGGLLPPGSPLFTPARRVFVVHRLLSSREIPPSAVQP